MPLSLGRKNSKMFREGKITGDAMIIARPQDKYERLQMYVMDAEGKADRMILHVPLGTPRIYLRRIRDFLLAQIAAGKVPDMDWLDDFRIEACKQLKKALKP